jgi:LmbE family N-acetylglucosaminyl deacetylase
VSISATLPSPALPSSDVPSPFPTSPFPTSPFPTSPFPTSPVPPAATVVVLHAHPDDEAIFTGLTVRRLADAGARVVLITATSGEQGVPRMPLAFGETVRARRVAELERACDLLGVSRLVLLGYSDSGCHRGPYRRGSLGAAPVHQVAERVAGVVAEESAQALVHYDPRGIYGHIDHVQVHRAGAAAIRRLQAVGRSVIGYEATVDAERLRRGPRHVLQGAAGEDLDVGVPADLIGLTVQAIPGDPELPAKLAAMAAHASQIGPEYLDPTSFAAGYGREWFVRRGVPGVIDELCAAPLGGRLVGVAG